jgi:hypothetical protein
LPLTSVTTDTAGEVDFNATLTSPNVSVQTSGAQTYNDDVKLLKDVILSSSNAAGLGNITFGKTINGAQALTVNTAGITQFNGLLGNTLPLTSVTTDAAGEVDFNATLGASEMSVKTNGAQTYNDDVKLLKDVILSSSNAGGVGNITFGKTVNGTQALTVNTAGVTQFNGLVGNTLPLTSVTTDTAGEVDFNATLTSPNVSVQTSGAQTFNDDVKLLKDVILSSSNAGGVGNITFGKTVNGAQALTVNTAGVTQFNGLVGNAAALTNLTTDAGASGSVAIRGGSITTSGTQHYGETVMLSGATTLTASGVTFENTVSGDNSLRVVGATTLNGGSVVTNGTQTYSGAIHLGAATEFKSTMGTLNFVSMSDQTLGLDLTLQAATALVLGDVNIVGQLHVTTHAGGVSQQPNSRLNVGGTTTFTADTGMLQIASLTGINNTFSGLVTFDQSHLGSWADVSVTTQTPLTLGPLQSSGTVSLQTQGATLTTTNITASGDVNLNSGGGAVSIGAATVAGNFVVQTAGGRVAQTGQMVVSGDTAITAGTGTVTLDNVLNNFGGTLAVQGQSTSVATSGNLQLASVSNTGPMTLRAPNGSIDLGTAFITGGDLTLQSRDNMNLGGANITGSLNMSSTQGKVSFGQATVTGNLTASTQGQLVDLGSANVGGNLLVQTHGGNVVQSTAPNSALHVLGTSNLNTGSGNVTLPNVPNQFGGPVSLQANNVELVGSNGLVLDNSTITGDLRVTAATGNVTQTPAGVLNVTGTSVFNATKGDVVLAQDNTLTQAVSVNAINATLNTTSALTLDTSSITGNLNLKVAQGDITQTGPVQVTGTSQILANAGNITLNDTTNRFGDRVSISTPQALQLSADGPLSMGEVSVGKTTDLQSNGKLDLGTSALYNGKLKAKSGGFDIVQSGPLKAGADVDFDAGNGKIDLFEPKNLWFGALFFKGGIIMINHPQLLNAVSSGVLMVRVETTMPTPMVRVAAPVSASPAVSAASTATPAASTQNITNSNAGTGNATVTVAVSRSPTANQTGLIQVQVPAEAAAPGKSFSFELDPHVVAGHAPDAPVKIAQVDGKPLPNWLKYDAASKTFSANEVPPGAFPLQIKVSVGNTESVMVIQEKPGN